MGTFAFLNKLNFIKKSLAKHWPSPALEVEQAERPGYYDLVWTPVDEQDMPALFTDKEGRSFVAAFTKEEFILRIYRAHSLSELSRRDLKNGPLGIKARQFMLGDLTGRFQNQKSPMPIFLNPIKILPTDGIEYIAEEVVFAPIFDPLTKKMMTTSTDEALALMAISSEDMARFGIEFVFHMITNHNAPDDKDEKINPQNNRETFLKGKLQELLFFAPRTPIKRGSGSVFCVILNLENSMEEMGFIRQYKTLDPYSNVLFVTSTLEILDGDLNNISYDGDHIDTIFAPIIEWQNGQSTKYLNVKPSIPLQNFHQ